MSDLREFLQIIEERGELLRIRKAVSPRFEIASILKKYDNGPAIFFEKVKGSKMKAVGGVCGTRDRLSLALGTEKTKIHETLSQAYNYLVKPRQTNDAPVKEVIEKPNLEDLPIVTHYEKDAGPYITAGIVFAKDPNTGIQNASFHRMLFIDKDHLIVRIVPRHLHRIFTLLKEKNRPLEVAIAIGLHPTVMLGSSASIPYGQNEMMVSNALLKNSFELTKCANVDILVPADAEIVLEGYILPEREGKEWMTDILGLYDVPRKQPILELIGVMRRRDSIYQALLPAGSEHILLMGLNREVSIWESVRKVVPEVKGVNLTLGSGGWLHAIIAVRKQSEGDAKNVILASFGAHSSLKMCTVVDVDIDIYDPNDVDWAVSTRMQPDKDVIIISDVRSSSLDPSSNQNHLITSKIGIDATATLLKKPEKFLRARIPIEEEAKPNKFEKL
jgi:UbiD family decarboxylase